MRFVLQVCYDGTNYFGWQTQKNGITVQQTLEKALSLILNQNIKVVASGRTDSGVHAFGQVCHFDSDTTIPPTKIADAVNCKLPEDIKVLKSALAPENFNANKSAKRKTYVYKFYLSDKKIPLLERYAERLNKNIDVKKMEKASKILIGEHDFKCFCASGSSVLSTIRTIYDIKINIIENTLFSELEIEVCGNGFLYNMVRTIAGQLVAIGEGLMTEDTLKQAVLTQNRKILAKTMPSKGLILIKVNYGIDLFL